MTANDSPQGSQTTQWKMLRVHAEMFEDIVKTRIACANRVERGGVDAHLYKDQLDALEWAEKTMRKGLVKWYLQIVPPEIRDWQKNAIGIGDHLTARLLGVIGHPIHATPYHWEGVGENRVLVADEPYDRTVAQLWSYCGHGDPERKRRKGQSPEEAAASGNPRAKMLVHLMAECAMKQRRSPYRPVYDEARERYASREGWSDLRRHNAALRAVGKAILRDLWRAAAGHERLDPHLHSAGGASTPTDEVAA